MPAEVSTCGAKTSAGRSGAIVATTSSSGAGAKGSRMWDDKGNTWLDFSSQLVNVNIGHQHPRLVAAIQEQAGRLCTIAPSFANDMRSEAARLIAELAPGDLDTQRAGGFLGRKGDGHSGPKALWEGLMKLMAYVEALQTVHEVYGTAANCG